MSMGLEMRAPFLDHRLFEHIGSARPEWLTANEKGKLALRELYASLLPPAVFEREKAGFAPPVVDWLRGKRLEALMARIESPRARIYDVLDRRAVSLLFQAFERRIHNVVGRIWCVLLLETWLARWAPVIDERG
jgi:asparagine synthase (glutamine-hydrolysing)